MQKHLESSKKSTAYLLSRLKTYEKKAATNSWTIHDQPIDLLDCLRALAASGDKNVIATLEKYLGKSPELKPVLDMIQEMGKTFFSMEESLWNQLKQGVEFAKHGYLYVSKTLLNPRVSQKEKNDLIYLIQLNKEYPPERLTLFRKLASDKKLYDGLLWTNALPVWKNEVKRLTPVQLKQYINFYKNLLYTSTDPKMHQYILSNFEVLSRTGTMSPAESLAIIEKTPNPEETSELLKSFKFIRRRLKLKVSNAKKKQNGEQKKSFLGFLKGN